MIAEWSFNKFDWSKLFLSDLAKSLIGERLSIDLIADWSFNKFDCWTK